MRNYLLGYDLGSSSVKASLIDAESGNLISSVIAPTEEMDIQAPKHGWAEQNPEDWWKNSIEATKQVINKAGINPKDILAIGISYQMHGLVLVDKNQEVIRPSIIWCDSRAVETGDHAFEALGAAYCTGSLLNSPGNFTASKLRWVQQREPEVYAKIHKVMLPGDYLAMKMTGEIATTIPGLSEGIFWDYRKQAVSDKLLKLYDIDSALLAPVVPTFGLQGKITDAAAAELGLTAGIPVTYRAGDQPNNAFSLNVLHPGEVATTAGTSGVIYGVVDKPVADKLFRVNTFVHVTHTSVEKRYGVMLCVNGTGILNRWLQKNISNKGKPVSYEDMNTLATAAPIGSDGLLVLPFGNGAERVLQNQEIDASFHGLNFNRHKTEHLCRAVQEGIVFSLGYGFEILKNVGIQSGVIRAGYANMFLSDIFCQIFTNITGTSLQLYNTDGAQGAARGAGVGIKHYANASEAFNSLACIKHYEPVTEIQRQYEQPYAQWKSILNQQLVHK